MIEKTTFYPLSLFIESTLIELDFLKNIVRIANPIAASAAATTKINKEKNLSRQISKNIRESNKIYVCREKHQFNRHKNSNKIFSDLQKYLKSQ